MTKKFLPTLGFVLILGIAQAQDNVVQNTNVDALKQLEAQLREANQQKREAVALYAQDHNLLVHHYLPNGKVISMVDIDKDGKPVYKTTFNAKASATISTNRVYPNVNTASRYNLSGRGFIVGEWDGGTTRVTHREFQGRAIQADNGTMALSEHATHVAGTIAAGGVSPALKGMAYQTTLYTHDWEGDDAEMTARAAQGLLVSNHSYGTPCGWDVGDGGGYQWYGDNAISTAFDYKFGFYNNDARIWDRISFNAPFYLIVKSAGNSRGDGPSSGQPANNPQYDCIPTYSVAKNILTVGAVHPLVNGYSSTSPPTQVSMTSFSSWGPADDGRIKPDIVGDGEGVISCGIASDQQQVTLSGTSMSGPSVAGSCLLLQEHYSNTHFRKKMRSATLKALVIHTADECWIAPGPDYRYGWGLMNTLKASALISADSIGSRMVENNLVNGAHEQLTVVAKGGEKLIATLCWTDFEGTPGPPAYNSRLAMLVNDLDLRISGPGLAGDSLPWRLNPDSAAFGARRGDNKVDNVEKIEIDAPVAGGIYTITVRHKGTLFAGTGNPQQQVYSLIVSGIIAGDQNKTCLPLQWVNARAGRIDDGSGAANYFDGADCKWVLNPEDTAAIVRMVFKNFNVDPSDTLYIRNGANGADGLVGKYTGSTLPDTVYSTKPQVLIHFKGNNGGSAAAGWDIEFGAIRRPRFDFAAASQNICNGASVAFTAQNLDTEIAGWVYTWTFPGAQQTTMIGQTVSPVYNTNGTFPASLTVTNKYGPATVSKTDYITVKPEIPAQFTPYFQGFESATFPADPSGNTDLKWTLATDANPWMRNTAAPFSGEAAIRIRNNTNLKNIRELVSPTFNVSDVPTAKRGLSFRVAFARYSTATAADQLRVLYSSDCGKTWTEGYKKSNTTAQRLSTIGTDVETGLFFPLPEQYRKDTVAFTNLPANATNLTFKFEMTSEKGNFLYLDDIQLNQFFVGVEKFKRADRLDLMVVPNPSESQATIMVKNPSSGATTLQLLDFAGRAVKELSIRNFDGEAMAEIQTEEVFGKVNAGIYLIRVQSGVSARTIKWVVK